jgi:hypothetical protein
MSEPPEERYVAVDLAVLAAIKELDWIHRVDWQLLPAISLILRVVRVDRTSNTLVVGVRLTRSLDEPKERGFGSI